MKTRLFSLAILAMALSACTHQPHPATSVDTDHNARIALDWAGTYRGVLPCADCEGIKTVVTLAENGTYETTSEYLGRNVAPTAEKGRFTWDAAGNKITLEQSEPDHYFVSENRLIRLAPDGSRITGAMAELYVLPKVKGSN